MLALFRVMLLCSISGLAAAQNVIYSCDFEDESRFSDRIFCDMTQDMNPIDDFDWIRKSGDTGSPHTGPDGGYGGSMYYGLFDVTWRSSGNTASLTLDLPGLSSCYCVQCKYYMYGTSDGMGSLKVQQLNENLVSDIWEMSGNRGKQWYSATFSTQANNPSALRFVAEATGSPYGDIALDNIEVLSGCCGSVPTPPPPPTSDVFFCSFERADCGLEDVGQLQWERVAQNAFDPKTSSDGSYFAVVKPYGGSETAVLMGKIQPTSVNMCMCLSFDYYLNLGTFEVKAWTSSMNWIKVYSKTNERNTWWKSDQASLPYNTEYVSFVGKSLQYGVGLDDVRITRSCCSSVTTTPPPPPTISPIVFQCNFESSFCSFLQSDNFLKRFTDDVDWDRTRTGLALQTPGSMYYASMSSSNSSPKSVAILAIALSPVYPCLCLKFDYFLYGTGFGSLEVVILENTKYGTTIWDRSARQVDAWDSAEVEIRNRQVTLICIQATRGYANSGYIAVDNVVLLGRCCTMPTTTTTTTTTPPPPPTQATTPSPYCFICDFESDADFFGNNFCGFIQLPNDNVYDNRDWSRAKLGFNPQNQGTVQIPGYGGSLGYAYARFSPSDPSYSKATLEIDLSSKPSSCYCLKFAFITGGNRMGQLEVLVIPSGHKREESVWRFRGVHGNLWREAQVQVSKRIQAFRIRATKGVMGTSFGGLIDNVKVLCACCPVPTLPPTTTTPPPPPTTTTRPRPPQPCLNLEYCLDCICHEQNFLGSANGVTYVDTCGISRSYFFECAATGLMTLPNPTYEACMLDNACKRECIAAYVNKHLLECVGTTHLYYASCFDVTRTHFGKMCKGRYAMDFGYKVMSKYYSLPHKQDNGMRG